MNVKKFVGISTLFLSLLLLVIAYLSCAYEYVAYSTYAKAAKIDELYVIFILTLYMIFSTPIAFVCFILLLIAGIKYLRDTAGKKTRIITLVVKAIAAIGLLALFIAYLVLYPTGWISKAFYIATAVLSAISFFIDFYLVDTKEKELPKGKRQSNRK